MKNSPSSDPFEGYPEKWLYRSNWYLYQIVFETFLGSKELDDFVDVRLMISRLQKYKQDLSKIKQSTKTDSDAKREDVFLSERQKEFEQELKKILPFIKTYHHRLSNAVIKALEDRGVYL